MTPVIIAHDYQCPWCWIGLFQAKRLQNDFLQISLDWCGYELLPESLGELPNEFDRTYPERLLALAETERIPMPPRKVGLIRSHNALESAEFVKRTAPDLFDAYNENVYRAFWERGEDISDMRILETIARRSGIEDTSALTEAVNSQAFADHIVPFDDAAYAKGICHVPTFKFLAEQCAEAPYETIRGIAERALERQG